MSHIQDNQPKIVTHDRICVLIPTYHNEGTIVDVLEGVFKYLSHVIVVVDGDPQEIVRQIEQSGLTPHIVSYERNRGKGYALKRGFQEARALGFDFVITFDGDGQHYPSDIARLTASHALHPEALIVGERSFDDENMPSGSNFANRFSNFWFRFQTGIRLNDTQTGLRLYPLKRINPNWPITARYESELEFLVYSAWKDIPIVSEPVNVYYPPQEERVSHFRPFFDFFRISLLNTLFTCCAVFYFIPKRWIRRCHR